MSPAAHVTSRASGVRLVQEDSLLRCCFYLHKIYEDSPLCVAKMDEAEKYKQRLEAIAEKRRLLEEQERAKREMEEEKLRLQQLKRKSLRDQWLMEGPPLSPTSLDAPAPRSPLWRTQAQEIEKHIDNLVSETQRLEEDEKKLKEEMENGQTDTVNTGDMATEMVQDVVHNGEIATESGKEIKNKSPQLDKSKVFLTNGARDKEEDTSHEASLDVQFTTNGLIEATKSGQVANMVTNDNEEEEEGTVVIRAECVIITDEADDVAEEETEGNNCNEETDTFNLEEPIEAVSEKTEEKIATTNEDGLSESGVISNGIEEEKLKAITTVQLQSPAQDGAVVVSLPDYTETQPCVITSQAEAETEERDKIVSKPQENVTVVFQEVPLSEPQDKQNPGEVEPLLSQAKAQETQIKPTATSSATETETQSPNRDDQTDKTKAAKHKTCQCCSVM